MISKRAKEVVLAENCPRASIIQEEDDKDRRLRREIEFSNERTRMHNINEGFQSLRRLLPHHEGEQLSKVVILEQIAEYISLLKQEESQLREKNSVLKRLHSLAQQNSEETYHVEQEKTQLIMLYGNLCQQSLTSPSLGNSMGQTGLTKMINENEGRELVPGELTSREIAHYKERRRMQCINAGFEKLRPLLPQHKGEKLGKAAILQQTAEYIHKLEQEKARLLSQNEQLERLWRMANPNEQGLTGNSAEPAGLSESSRSPRIEKKGLVCFFDYYLVTTHLYVCLIWVLPE